MEDTNYLIKNINYPIKYAVQPIHQISETLDLDDILFVGYIVTKCFVVKELTSFLKDGTYIKEYNVVYPFKGMNAFKLGKKIRIPNVTVNYLNEVVCTNSDHVDMLFETYEDAKKICDLKNSKLAKNEELQKFEDDVTKATEIMHVNTEKNKQLKKTIY